MSNRDELHRLADELPEDLAGQLLDFGAYLRGRGDAPGMEEADRAWEYHAAAGLAERLAQVESDADPEAHRAWLAAFETGGRPCRYVPGEGFVAL